MKENFNEEMQEVKDLSAEISEQQSRIIRAEADIRATDTDAITAILGYLCGDVDKTRIEELYAQRHDSALEIIEAKNKISCYDELGKEVVHETGDYLDPILYKDGMKIVEGKWYYLDDKDLPHEAVKSGIPAGFNDKEYFDFVE